MQDGLSAESKKRQVACQAVLRRKEEQTLNSAGMAIMVDQDGFAMVTQIVYGYKNLKKPDENSHEPT